MVNARRRKKGDKVKIQRLGRRLERRWNRAGLSREERINLVDNWIAAIDERDARVAEVIRQQKERCRHTPITV